MARLLQLTDLHAVRRGSLVAGILDTPAILRGAVDLILTRMDAIGPLDAVLVTGDITEDGSADGYGVARAELDRLGLPLLVVPGNHDRREALRFAFRDLPDMPEGGPVDWVADIGGARIIGLDTLVEGEGGGRLQADSLTFLRGAVAGAGERAIVVALHHPPLRTGVRFIDEICLDNAGELAVALEPARAPVRIVAGHVHGVYHGQLGRHPVSTAPSLCSAFALDLRQDAPVGFMTGPTGYAVLATGEDGVWAAQPLEAADGPHGF